MTADEYLLIIETGEMDTRGFWNEAEAVKQRPVRDVTDSYIEENNYD